MERLILKATRAWSAAGLLALALAPAARREPLESRIAARVRRFEGTMGVAAKNLETGEEISVNGDARFPTASLIKVAVMVVRGPKSRYVIAICARKGKDRRPTADNAALPAGAEISRMIYDAFEGTPAPGRR